MGEKFCVTRIITYNMLYQGYRWTDFLNIRRILLLTFGRQIREITSKIHYKKQSVYLRNRVGNSLRCNVTSSALFGPEVPKFYNTEKEIQNYIVVYFNCSANCNSSDRFWDFLSQGFQFEFLSENRRSPLRFVTFSSLSNYCLILKISKDRSLPYPFQYIIHYHLIKRNF
jgi:hypothetical protein